MGGGKGGWQGHLSTNETFDKKLREVMIWCSEEHCCLYVTDWDLIPCAWTPWAILLTNITFSYLCHLI